MRPILNKQTDADEFILYYWLKEDLVSFCKEQGLSTGGSKEELTKRVLESISNLPFLSLQVMEFIKSSLLNLSAFRSNSMISSSLIVIPDNSLLIAESAI